MAEPPPLGSAGDLGDGAPVLVACAHGTRAPAGRRTMGLLRLDVAAARQGLEVVAAHLDVHKPALDDVVARLAAAGRRMVIVPLLLSSGYHVRVDVGRAAAVAAGGLAVPAAALGPEPVLVDVLQQRLAECGAGQGDAIVMAAAGSSDPRATADVELTARWLSDLRGAPVRPAYLAAASPSVPEAVAAMRRDHPGRGVTIATYLLAPGLFSARLDAAGADRVAAPLAPHPALATLVLQRFDEAVARVPAPA
jgi:sirohydrochlorin ferrochelatase